MAPPAPPDRPNTQMKKSTAQQQQRTGRRASSSSSLGPSASASAAATAEAAATATASEIALPADKRSTPNAIATLQQLGAQASQLTRHSVESAAVERVAGSVHHLLPSQPSHTSPPPKAAALPRHRASASPSSAQSSPHGSPQPFQLRLGPTAISGIPPVVVKATPIVPPKSLSASSSSAQANAAVPLKKTSSTPSTLPKKDAAPPSSLQTPSQQQQQQQRLHVLHEQATMAKAQQQQLQQQQKLLKEQQQEQVRHIFQLYHQRSIDFPSQQPQQQKQPQQLQQPQQQLQASPVALNTIAPANGHHSAAKNNLTADLSLASTPSVDKPGHAQLQQLENLKRLVAPKAPAAAAAPAAVPDGEKSLRNTVLPVADGAKDTSMANVGNATRHVPSQETAGAPPREEEAEQREKEKKEKEMERMSPVAGPLRGMSPPDLRQLPIFDEKRPKTASASALDTTTTTTAAASASGVKRQSVLYLPFDFVRVDQFAQHRADRKARFSIPIARRRAQRARARLRCPSFFLRPARTTIRIPGMPMAVRQGHSTATGKPASSTSLLLPPPPPSSSSLLSAASTGLGAMSRKRREQLMTPKDRVVQGGGDDDEGALRRRTDRRTGSAMVVDDDEDEDDRDHDFEKMQKDMAAKKQNGGQNTATMDTLMDVDEDMGSGTRGKDETDDPEEVMVRPGGTKKRLGGAEHRYRVIDDEERSRSRGRRRDEHDTVESHGASSRLSRGVVASSSSSTAAIVSATTVDADASSVPAAASRRGINKGKESVERTTRKSAEPMVEYRRRRSKSRYHDILCEWANCEFVTRDQALLNEHVMESHLATPIGTVDFTRSILFEKKAAVLQRENDRLRQCARFLLQGTWQSSMRHGTAEQQQASYPYAYPALNPNAMATDDPDEGSMPHRSKEEIAVLSKVADLLTGEVDSILTRSAIVVAPRRSGLNIPARIGESCNIISPICFRPYKSPPPAAAAPPPSTASTPATANQPMLTSPTMTALPTAILLPPPSQSDTNGEEMER